MASLMGFAVAGCERFRGVSIRSVPVVVGLPVMLKVAAGSWDFYCWWRKYSREGIIQ